MTAKSVTNALARCFLADDPRLEGILQRCEHLLGRRWHWVERVARRFEAAHAGKARPRHRDVAAFISNDRSFQLAWRRIPGRLTPVLLLTKPPRMQPVSAAGTWNLPRIESAGALADWLWLDYGDLDWFADLKGLCRTAPHPQLKHYHYRTLQKPSGGFRLIETPKPRLKEIQRQILDEILARIPVHPAAHGFTAGRSILTFAKPHVARPVVLRLDLREFFPKFSGARIQTFFRTIGYPEVVADLLGGICTTCAPFRGENDRYAIRHLPQGAPTSPALANLCAYRTDCRLTGLAKSAEAVYTRYADDLAFSGGEDFARNAAGFALHVAAILSEEGFAVNHRKTRIMRQGVRQHVAGLVINERLNVRRTDFDCLKATLTNCVRHGLESQNRDGHIAFRSHLQGRVAFFEMVNPAKGERLRKILNRIA